MADIFISYASEDRGWVRKLATTLEESGWSVWWDRDIIIGQAFDQVIEHELEIAKSIIVVWSKNSIYSEWVKNEASVALGFDRLIPIMIDQIQIPLEFRRKQTADLTNWGGASVPHEGFRRMIGGLPEISKKVESGSEEKVEPSTAKAQKSEKVHSSYKKFEVVKNWGAIVIRQVGEKIGLSFGLLFVLLKKIPQRYRLYLSIAVLIAAILVPIAYVLNTPSSIADREPNNSISTANFIAIGDNVRGSIASIKDRDIYKFEALSNQTRVILSKLSTSGFHGKLHIYDAVENKIATKDEYGSVSVTLSFKSMVGTEYFIVIESENDGYHENGDYELAVKKEGS